MPQPRPLDRLSYTRLVRSSLVGTVVALVFDIAVQFLGSSGPVFSARQLPSYAISAIIGFAGGWLFDLFRTQTEVTEACLDTLHEIRARTSELTRRIDFQDDALSMLSDAPKHGEVLTALITASIKESFRSIPYVGAPAYLRMLGLATAHADRYEGVNRTTFHWYKESDAANYLHGLRDRPMALKTRLLLIDDEDEPAMRADLDDPAIMAYYWEHTGDVETYWMTVSAFTRAFPRRDLPQDFALYDRRLWIAYDEATQTLSFDVVDPDSDRTRLFDDLREMITGQDPSLRRVIRDAD